jgi:branched-chain amino acid transport system substrate-binding protein
MGRVALRLLRRSVFASIQQTLQTAVDGSREALRRVPATIVASDHQNTAEAGLAKTRAYCDVAGADAIFKMIASSVAIAVFDRAREKHKIAMACGPGVSTFSGRSN